jgi:lipopolysaccharide transport system ATP-binding protein
MKVRLAFSVAAHLEPEILIIDEVLAVGDVEFQKKCLGKMDEVAQSGRTVLLVSHNMGTIQSLSGRALTLESGSLVHDGTVEKAVEYYSLRASQASSAEVLFDDASRHFRRFAILEDGHPSTTIRMDASITFITDFQVPGNDNLALTISIRDQLGRRVLTANSEHQHRRRVLLAGHIVAECRMPNVRLSPGLYEIGIALRTSTQVIDREPRVACIEVLQADIYGTGTLPRSEVSVYHPEIEWSLATTADSLSTIAVRPA